MKIVQRVTWPNKSCSELEEGLRQLRVSGHKALHTKAATHGLILTQPYIYSKKAQPIIQTKMQHSAL